MIAVFIVLIGASVLASKYMLSTTDIEIESFKIKEDIKIVQLTDLHNSVFGESNKRLITLVNKQHPDLIVMTGDLVNAKDSRTDIAVNLIRELKEIAPVYVSMGNHEYEHDARFRVSTKQLFEDAGAVVMEKEYLDLTVKNQDIRLGGIYGYCLPAKYLRTGEAIKEECDFLSEFEDTDRYKILMCHMPVCWIINQGLDEWNIDCVVSGHVHGGEVIIPFVGGLYGPDFGWFYGRLQGLYSSDDGRKHLILSRGLGSAKSVPRVNNIPEVMNITITGK